MARINKHGFTIIETMLFLAISGSLVIALLVGTGVSIRNQRYRDSVTYLQSVIQDQYSRVSSVSNGMDGFGCDSLSVEISENNNVYRGHSDCVIIGRLIIPKENGTVFDSLEVYDVVSNEGDVDSYNNDDIKALTRDGSAKFEIFPISKEQYDIPWGASIYRQDDNNPFSVLILKSPLSGEVRTFIDNDNDVSAGSATVLEMVSVENLSNTITLCVEASSESGPKSAVRVNAGASNASGVETLGADSGCL